MGLFSFLQKKTSLIESGLLEGSKDCHSHILFGVDDGIATLDQSLEVLDFLEKSGVKDLWCTPHVMEDVPNTTARLQERFAQLQQAYKGAINLHLAAEYMLDSVFEQRLEDNDLLPLYDDVVLVETSTGAPPINLIEILQRMMSKGYRPMLAHPERYRYLTMNDYERIESYGVYYQLNLASVLGFYGESAQKKAMMIMKNGWYKIVGSDCHRFATIQDQYAKEVLTPDMLEQLSRLLK